MDKNFEHLKIKDYKCWGLYLEVPHYYLGSVYLWAKRDDATNFLAMSSEEEKEFFHIAREVKNVLIDIFQVDKFNIVNLQNKANHLHVHIIPRYSTPRVFDGYKFVDENWGKMFYPYNEDIEIPQNIILQIIDKIKNKLK